MKRVFFVFIALIVFLTACGNIKKTDPFADINSDFEADAELICNGAESSISVKAEKSEGSPRRLTVKILSPKELEGYTFSFDGEKYKLGIDGIDFTCEGFDLLPKMLQGAFSPNESEITAIGTEQKDGKNLSVVKTAAASYYFTSDGKPYSVSGTEYGRSYEIKFKSFSLKVENGI